MQDFEILSDGFTRPMHENPQRVSSVVKVDVSGPYLQGAVRVFGIFQAKLVTSIKKGKSAPHSTHRISLKIRCC